MNTRLILATLARGILYFFLGWLFYGVLLMDFYNANTVHYEGLMKEMPNLYLFAIGNLITAFLFSWIFQRWAGFRTLLKGLNGGLFLSFFIVLPFDLFFLGAWNLYSIKYIVVDIVTSTVLGGIIGGVIGWILGFRLKEVK